MPQLVMTPVLGTAAGNGLCGVSIGKKVIVPEYEDTSPATQGSPTWVAAEAPAATLRQIASAAPPTTRTRRILIRSPSN
jgi:hypothetical protein